MELQICNNYEKNDTMYYNQYNFIILTIIYIIFISVIIFIKQPIIVEVPEVPVEVPIEVPVVPEVPVEVPVEVPEEVYEKCAFIAIKKYGDAYVKLKALGDISSHNYRYPSNVWIIDSHERNELINKNVIYKSYSNIYATHRYNFIKNIFRDERDKYYEEQVAIARTEALYAMKKANLFDDLFDEFLKYD